MSTSGRPDLNRGPHRPERCALPGCATPRERRLSQSVAGGGSCLGRGGATLPRGKVLRWLCHASSSLWSRSSSRRCSPVSARADIPRGFVGVSPQSAAKASDYELMREAGISSVPAAALLERGPVEEPLSGGPRLEGVRPRSRGRRAGGDPGAARSSTGTPGWAAPEPNVLPVSNPLQRWAWSSFLRAAAERYGRDGEFWEEHPDLPYLPIKRWEIWNEQNIVSFDADPRPARFAMLLRISGRTLQADRPRAEGDHRRLLRPAAADPAQRRDRRLPRPRLRRPATSSPSSTGSACTPTSPTRARSAARCARCGGSCALHGDARDADLRDRAGLGLGQRPDPLGARPDRPGRTSSTAPSQLISANRHALAGRRRLVVHLERRRRHLQLLRAPPAC